MTRHIVELSYGMFNYECVAVLPHMCISAHTRMGIQYEYTWLNDCIANNELFLHGCIGCMHAGDMGCMHVSRVGIAIPILLYVSLFINCLQVIVIYVS